jgi:hypothetical protein
MSAEGKRKAREKARAYRERMRAKGLRPIQLWVPDTRTPEFTERAHRESRAIAESPGEADDQAFVDAASEDIFK